MPPPSYMPVLVALGLTIIATGMVVQFPAIVVVGFVVMIASLYAWAFEPNH